MHEYLELSIKIMGGVGLFLLGMVTMTNGLSQLTGKSIRHSLMSFTSSPVSGVMCGAISTAIVQSSSAVTVATVGFVRAGLMDFSHALGVIFGANIGTTITGWLVLLLGFKLKIGVLVYPFIFCGVLLKLFAPVRLGAIGLALAGFGLIFTGIDTLQTGMSGLRSAFDFSQYPAIDFLDRVSVAIVGIVFTLVTQSSSAGVASTLAALYAGLITFEQAAALVVGMDVGTSVTAALATTGASTETKRAGFSHVIYNLLTGLTAIIIIPLFIRLWQAIDGQSVTANAEIALISFHSLFNVLGVIIILPFIKQFVQLMMWLVPGRPEESLLDDSLLRQPDIALDNAHKTLFRFLSVLTVHLSDILSGKNAASDKALEKLKHQLEHTEAFIDAIDINTGDNIQKQRLIEMVHSLDHMQRLLERIDEEPQRILSTERPKALHDYALKINQIIIPLQKSESVSHWQSEYRELKSVHDQVKAAYQPVRLELLEKIAGAKTDISDATNIMEAYRWLKRITEHLYKITLHLDKAIIGLPLQHDTYPP